MRGSVQSRLVRLILTTGLLCALWAYPAAAKSQTPSWWKDAQMAADTDGYGLITTQEVEVLIKKGGDYLLLDVRPAYEFKDGHLPNSKNLEFHLGDRLKLSPEKEKALKTLIGPDPERVVVVYCRSFR